MAERLIFCFGVAGDMRIGTRNQLIGGVFGHHVQCVDGPQCGPLAAHDPV